jgi:transposase
MDQPIMVACDLHDNTMLLLNAQGREKPVKRSVKNTREGRAKLIADLQAQSRAAGNARVIFAYEASGQGFGFYDELTAAGIECHVLAPTKIVRSAKQKKQKTDEKDAELILEILRAHILAGNKLPAVWIPDPQTRDDREIVRARLDAADKATALKAQIKGLLKRNQLARPDGLGKGWTRRYWAWLRHLCKEPTGGLGLRETLASLMRQLEFMQKEIDRLELTMGKLSETPRYAAAVGELTKLQGVGLVTAMVFLAEVGDLQRFKNRRQIAAYLGLAPCAFESGNTSDRKGHITRQGPSRVRRVLCQAIWAQVRTDKDEKTAYHRILSKNPKKKKIAVVAMMRRLAVRMWHKGEEAQRGITTVLVKPAEKKLPRKRRAVGAV